MINDLHIFHHNPFKDNRGFFKEIFNNKISSKLPIFVQDNLSFSKKNVIRGLHFQAAPYSQGKLVSIVKGKIFDVVVNIDKNSNDFGKWKSFILSDENNKQLWVPEGYAHGFMALADENYVLYKTTNFYNKDSEKTILWNDPDLAIEWPLNGSNPLVSEKDAAGSLFKDCFI